MTSMQDEYQLCVVGTGGVGKSALTIQFLRNKFVTDYDPTIEESYRKQLVVDNISSYLNILDTAGQEEFSAMRDQYMAHSEGFLMVYNVIDSNSFKEMETIIGQITRAKEDTQPPLVLVANKIDLDSKRVITEKEGKSLANKYGIPYIETSAKTRKNVDEIFVELVREVRKDRLGNGSNGNSGCCTII